MDIVRLRFEARQCHLRAVRSIDRAEAARLHALGARLTMLADQAQRMAGMRPKGVPHDPSHGRFPEQA